MKARGKMHPEKIDEGLILTLARQLSGNQVSTELICQCLELICSSFAFDCGSVYEIDQFNTFHLKERHDNGAVQKCESLSLDSIEPIYRHGSVKGNTCHIHAEKNSFPEEKRLLDMFSVNYLLLFFVVDENSRIIGLIVFSKLDAVEISAADQNILATLLSLFGRYAGIRMYQNKLSFVKKSLESIIDNTGIDIYVNDFYTHEILYANRSMAAPYGGIDSFLGHKCWEVLFPGQDGPCQFCPQQHLLDENGYPSNVYTWNYQRPFDGSWFRVFSAAFQWVDGRLAHVVSSADITENKRNEEIIQYMANFDSLTGLPNRRMLLNECKSRIDHASETENGYLLFFDIDGFKNINDSLGHDAGDEFLVKLGEFFNGVPLLKNGIYRNGGDEFIAIIGGENLTKLNVSNLVRFIHDRFKKPWILKKGSVFCNTSVGVACFPEDGRTADELLQKADEAMYQVKKRGGGGICFGHQIEA